jgi:hypothetical protein
MFWASFSMNKEEDKLLQICGGIYLKERDHLGFITMDEKVVLNWISVNWCAGVGWIQVA